MGAARRLEPTRTQTKARVVKHTKTKRPPVAKRGIAEGRKLTKVGNSYAAIIPRQVMAVLGLNADTRLRYTTDGRSLVISPVPDDTRATLVADAIDHVFSRYRKTMLTLAGR